MTIAGTGFLRIDGQEPVVQVAGSTLTPTLTCSIQRDLNNLTVEYCDEIYTTIDDADAVILLTEWNVYRGLDLEDVLGRMRGRTFVDLRNVYEPDDMRRAGFDYVCVGR